jgi:hypothetical protein
VSRAAHLGWLVVTACGRVGFEGPDGAAGPQPDAAIAWSAEAESGAVVDAFMIIRDPTASGGSYVIDGNSLGLTGAGQVTDAIDLPGAGTYYLWYRTIAIDGASDSFFLSVDGGADVTADTADCVHSAAWQWSVLRVGAQLMCPTLSPVVPFSLSAGRHTFELHSREGQSIVDRILVTQDLAFVPAG